MDKVCISYTIIMDKVRILLFGRSGAGKSTIANELLREEVCKTGDGVVGVTMECKTYSNEKSIYEIIDTIGIGETELGSTPHEQAVENMELFLRQLCIELHHVCFVVPAGRFDGLNEVFWITFNKIFAKSANNIAVIVTKCEKEWVEKNKTDIESILGHVPIIGVDFPPYSNNPLREEPNIEDRKESLEKLENFLLTIRAQPGYSTSNPNPDFYMVYDIVNVLYKIGRRTKTHTAGWFNKILKHIKNFFDEHYIN